jgi:sulfur-oxidizing protein SoxB
MVRVGGLQYTVNPTAKMGSRITDLRLKGKPLDPNKKYRVAGWASVQEGVSGTPIWEVVAEYLRSVKVVKNLKVNRPTIVGLGKNPGLA